MTATNSKPSSNFDDKTQLIAGCRHCLTQCELLLSLISEQDFTACNGGSSVGTHLRHVLDRFQSLFNGLPTRTVNYDARQRDQAIESNLEAAGFALESIARRIDLLQDTTGSELTVQESVYHEGPSVTIASTLERELMGLITHTTHHLAIIALLIKPLGYRLNQDFGKAPSTILYEQQVRPA